MIPYTNWLGLKLSTRVEIAKQLGIPKVRSTSVVNDIVVDDGYDIKNVEDAIKVVPMQTYLGSTETDVFKLFDELVKKAEGTYVPKLEVTITPINTTVEVKKVKKAKKKK